MLDRGQVWLGGQRLHAARGLSPAGTTPTVTPPRMGEYLPHYPLAGLRQERRRLAPTAFPVVTGR